MSTMFDSHDAAHCAAVRLLENIERTLAALIDSGGGIALPDNIEESEKPQILAAVVALRDGLETLRDAVETPCTCEELEEVAAPLREAWELVHPFTVDVEDELADAPEAEGV